MALVALTALIAWLAGSAGSGGRAGGDAAPMAVTMHVTLPRMAVVGAGVTAGTLNATGAADATGASPTATGPPLPWPSTGEAAVDIPAVGYRAQSGIERSVPIASMTKIMTAYVVLADHPLALGQQGPRVRITAADAAQFGIDTVTDQANVIVKTGEVLTEYQMLEGLLVHSANDLAYALATWDAGSLRAFLDKMNATAAALGMVHTHYADASGLTPSSRSTAADLLRVAAAAMSDPVFAQIVSMPSVTLPLAGAVESYTPLDGSTGVVGVKSGFTDAAGGGDVLAYKASVDGHTFISLAAVTSQEGPTVLETAGKEALALAQAAAARVEVAPVVGEGTVVAEAKAGTRTIPLATSAAASVLALQGARVRQLVHVRSPRPGTRRGTVMGTVTYVLASQRVSVPVRAVARVP